jgi:hypothetical protein
VTHERQSAHEQPRVTHERQSAHEQPRVTHERQSAHEQPRVSHEPQSTLEQPRVHHEQPDARLNMPASAAADRGLQQHSRAFRRPGVWFLIIGIALEAPGILLFVLGDSWIAALGLALMALGAPMVMVALGLLLSAAFANWAAHRRPFA